MQKHFRAPLRHLLTRDLLLVKPYQIARDDSHAREALPLAFGPFGEFAHIASVSSSDLQPRNIRAGDSIELNHPTLAVPGPQHGKC